MKEKQSKKTFKDYFVLAIGILAVALVLARAVIWLSPNNTSNDTESLYPTKVGVEPYQYNEHEQELLDLINLEGDIALLKIKAPREAKYLSFHVHTLKDDGTWDTTLVGEKDLSSHIDFMKYLEKTTPRQFEATLVLIRNEDFSIDMEFGFIKDAKGFLDDIPAPDVPFDVRSCAWGFLRESKSIELKQNIPIAFLLINKDNSSPITVGLADFKLTNSGFERIATNYDFAQYVTMTFSDEEAIM